MNFKIIEIDDYEEDRHEQAGDMCHMPEIDVLRIKVAEYEEKVEKGNWPGLPFECDAEDEEDAIQKYNSEHCRGDYYKAVSAIFEDNVDPEETEEDEE